MANIKDYIMNEAEDSIKESLAKRLSGYFVVIDANELISSGPLIMDLKVSYIRNKTEQEIKHLIADRIFINTYSSISVPDSAKVYLYIKGNQYLIENEYRPELYY